MTRGNQHEIERRLAEDRLPEPPADLAARIRAEIPEVLPSFTIEPDNVTPLRPRFGRRLLLAAAGLVLVAGSGAIAWRVLQQGAQHGPGLVPGMPPEEAHGSAAVPGDGSKEALRVAAPAAEEKAAAPVPVASGEAAEPIREDRVAPRAAAGSGSRDAAVGRPPALPAAAAKSAATRQVAAVCELFTVRVTDDADGVLPGASVTLSRLDATEVAARTGLTDAAGLASFRRLPAGVYRLSAGLAGFSAVRLDGVAVVAGAAGGIEVRLGQAAAAEAVAVVAEAPVSREADAAKAGTGGEAVRMNELQGVLQRVAGDEKRLAAARSGVDAAVFGVPAAVPPSTGGTSEPNDRPYGDVFFQHSGVNPFIDTEDDNLSTFGLDVDTGSYTVARRYLTDGNLPDPASVRVEEWVNYFKYGDRPPRKGDFAVTAEAAPTPFGESDRTRLVRFGIRARDIDDSRRKPAVLTFVVDVSGSMAREDRLGLVKRALFALLDRLEPADEVALVVYGSRGQVLLEPTADKEKVRSAIDRLQPGGSTNAEEGLVLAYDLASEAFRRSAVNRVILCSDGVANVGRTGPESILARIEKEAGRGIELTTVGFGMGNYNDVLMEQLADRGNGRYAYVDTFKEARRIFVENLTGTLQTIAVNAKVQVEFNPKVVSRYRLLGYENRDIADDRFRDDTVDAGEIGAGHTVTALYEVKLQERPARGEPLATLHLRYRPEEGREFVETAQRLTLVDVAASWEQASPSLQLAALVAETAEILKGSYWAKDGDLNDVFRRAQQLSAAFPGDVDVAEFVALVGSAARLKAPAVTPNTLPQEER